MTDQTTTPNPQPAPALRSRRNWKLGAAAAAILVVGAGIGATAFGLTRSGERVQFNQSLETTQISALADSDAIELQGKVVEIYGNKFIIEDGSGRALVETGRLGEDGDLVTKDEVLIVQGRFDDGFLHATALQHADGKIVELRAGPPPHERAHRGEGPGHDGPGRAGPDRDGPHHGPDGKPVPPAGEAPPADAPPPPQ
jgi:uncharacterized protein YdeI (BOF family)